MNSVILSGWLQFESEPRQTSNGNMMLSNAISVKNDFKGADGKYKYNSIKITAYGKTAEFINNYIHKGDKFLCKGRLDTYQDSKGLYVTNLVVESVEPLSSSGEQSENYSTKGLPFVEDNDDAPF